MTQGRDVTVLTSCLEVIFVCLLGDLFTNPSPGLAASGPVSEILASCLEVVIFIRRSFYKSLIFRVGGFRAEASGLEVITPMRAPFKST